MITADDDRRRAIQSRSLPDALDANGPNPVVDDFVDTILAIHGFGRKLDDILSGNLDHLIEPLNNEYQADQLAAMEQ